MRSRATANSARPPLRCLPERSCRRFLRRPASIRYFGMCPPDIAWYLVSGLFGCAAREASFQLSNGGRYQP